MTDDQVVARAAAGGWAWHDAPNRWGNAPGWQTGEHSFWSCSDPDPHGRNGKITRAQTAFAHDYDCRECKKPIDLTVGDGTKLIVRRECFHCNYWVERLKETAEHERVVVNGTHFIAGGWWDKEPAFGTTRDLGFGGRKFVVRFTAGPNVGKTLTTYNMWHQGKIPAHFRGRLPDNAEFVENTSAVRPEKESPP